jgi:hypothetical protein
MMSRKSRKEITVRLRVRASSHARTAMKRSGSSTTTACMKTEWGVRGSKNTVAKSYGPWMMRSTFTLMFLKLWSQETEIFWLIGRKNKKSFLTLLAGLEKLWQFLQLVLNPKDAFWRLEMSSPTRGLCWILTGQRN